jgi:glutamate---cysteine ligase / carboxylate-amine ligase
MCDDGTEPRARPARPSTSTAQILSNGPTTPADTLRDDPTVSFLATHEGGVATAAWPDWARWPAQPTVGEWSVGAEEEVMLLEPHQWRLAQAIDDVLPALSPELAPSVSAETHAGALELATGPHRTAGGVTAELTRLRERLAAELGGLGLRAAAAGTHPMAQWQDMEVSGGARYQLLWGTLRDLARREPTFALHVHVAVREPEVAIDVANRLRAHLPLLLALSANSPFWRGQDSGLVSARSPVFQAFPRAGIPRRFHSYADWVETVAALIDAGAFPEPTFLWWDVRLQPRFGTVEVRIMDAQSSLRDVGALVALTQAVARLEAEEHFAPEALLDAPEVLAENRFLAARDGVQAEFVDPISRRRVPLITAARELLEAARPHARQLGGLPELEAVQELLDAPPAERQRALARRPAGLAGVVESLSAGFTRAG